MQRPGVTLLVFGLLVVLSGCNATQAGNTPATTPQPTSAQPGTQSTEPEPIGSGVQIPACLTDAVPRPESTAGHTPMAYPEIETPGRAGALREWVVEFEQAYVINEFLTGARVSPVPATMHASPTVVDVAQTGDGLRIHTRTWSGVQYTPGPETTPLHLDLYIDATYIITRRQVIRVPTTGQDSGQRLTIVRC